MAIYVLLDVSDCGNTLDQFFYRNSRGVYKKTQ